MIQPFCFSWDWFVNISSESLKDISSDVIKSPQNEPIYSKCLCSKHCVRSTFDLLTLHQFLEGVSFQCSLPPSHRFNRNQFVSRDDSAPFLWAIQDLQELSNSPILSGNPWKAEEFCPSLISAVIQWIAVAVLDKVSGNIWSAMSQLGTWKSLLLNITHILVLFSSFVSSGFVSPGRSVSVGTSPTLRYLLACDHLARKPPVFSTYDIYTNEQVKWSECTLQINKSILKIVVSHIQIDRWQTAFAISRLLWESHRPG